jgi:flagellar secretion chaperone FliS
LAYGNAAQAYRKNATLTASPAQLVVMLYDGALRFMQEGKRALEAKDYELQNNKLQKAQKIVLELMGSLNFELGGEVSKNLLGLYTFVLDELVEGNMRDESHRIDNAMKVMSELREGWVEIERLSRENPDALKVQNAA